MRHDDKSRMDPKIEYCNADHAITNTIKNQLAH
jgi:hypothetical protein